MWECQNCDKRFQEPKAAYSISEGDTHTIITTDNEEFNWFVWANEDSWYFCPFCGSDNVEDLND